MIEFYVLPQTPLVLLDNYNELFDFICETENQLPFECPIGSGGSSWSFTVHSPHRVLFLYNNREKGSFAPAIDPNLQEAYDEQLSMLEICTGDYTNPQYVALTPNVDVYGLKKKWCWDYCQAHGLPITKTDDEGQNLKPLAGTKGSVPAFVDAVNPEDRGGSL